MQQSVELLRQTWSLPTAEGSLLPAELREGLLEEARAGVGTLGALLAILMLLMILAQSTLGFDPRGIYAGGAVIALAVATLSVASRLSTTFTLYLLAAALLIAAGAALLFAAGLAGRSGTPLATSVLVLFTLIPLVPWHLREAAPAAAALWLMGAVTMNSLHASAPAHGVLLQPLLMVATLASLIGVMRAALAQHRKLQLDETLTADAERFARLSNTDTLTGAWHRRYLGQAIEDLRGRFASSADRFHLVLFDLDGFKRLNDLCGHATGDRVLQCFSISLRERLGASGHLVRLGGDEFCAVFVDDRPRGWLEQAISEVEHRVRTLKGVADAPFAVSYGYATATLTEDASLAALYRRADQDMSESRAVRQCRHPREAVVLATTSATG